MKIMICGSMTFAKEMLKVKKQLEKLDHKIFLPPDIKDHLKNSLLVDDLKSNYKHAIKNNVIKESFNIVKKSDAILILNHKKNETEGYIGASSLMEIGLAYFFGKKIFILNKILKSDRVRSSHEISIINPLIINGDFSKIK